MKGKDTLLVLDEIQKIPRWSEVVKRFFDEDKIAGASLRVVLLGSSAFLMQRGLAESLAGRFEIHRHPQWSYSEMHECFSLTLDEYLYFGGYPGGVQLRKDENRWRHYIQDSLIETVLSKDVLLMTPVSKPALLRQALGLALQRPAEILSYQKMLGTLQDAGNTTTLASYLRLLSYAFLLYPLERWSGSRVKQRGSTPKILVLDNALVSATMDRGFKQVKADKTLWGRMLENAVGAKLYFLCQGFGLGLGVNLFYWRDRQEEVDYVLQKGASLIAFEVKSSLSPSDFSPLLSFLRRHKNARGIVISKAKIDPSFRPPSDHIQVLSAERFFSDTRSSIGW